MKYLIFIHESNFNNLFILLFAMFLFSSNSHSQFNNEFKWKTQTEIADYTIIGDFNGDRRSDIAYHVPTTPPTPTYWRMMFSTGSGFTEPVSVASGQGINNGVWTGDFNGDGLSDKVSWVNSTDATWGGWWVALMQRDINGNYSILNEVKWKGQTEIIDCTTVGDFNGDGLTDIAYHVPTTPPTPTYWRMMFSTGSGFTEPVSVASGQGINNGVWTGDFNGDGLSDKVSWVNSTDATWGGWWVALMQRDINGNYSILNEVKWKGQTEIIDCTTVGDFNGDSKADLGYHIPTNDTWKVMLSDGTSFTNPIPWTVGQGINSGVFSGDFDGEGLTDKISWVNSTDSRWGGWWVATTVNTQTPKVGVDYYPAYYVYPGANPREDEQLLWYKKDRDTLKTPVVGWGTDTTVGDYSCQDTATLRRQIQAMKTAGIDFIVTDITNGLYPANPAYSDAMGYQGDGVSTNGLEKLFTVMNLLPSEQQVQIAIALGYEFWGAHSMCYTRQNWDGWDNQYLRQQNAIIRLNSYLTASYYFRYLGKPLVLTYIDLGLDYPTNSRPLWHFKDLTLRNEINWGMTYAQWMNVVGAEGCVDPSSQFFDGINNKRFWGWGAGATDISGAWDTRMLPSDAEEMSIMPGTRLWLSPGDPVKISRRYGDEEYYIRSWKQVIATRPKIVFITDWNNWNEETAIEGCVGDNGWKDYYGTSTYDWYLQITQAYSAILKTGIIPTGTYVRDEYQNEVFLTNGYCLSYQSLLPHGKPVIVLPSGWLISNGYYSSLISQPSLVSPINGSTNISLMPRLKWNKASGALVYQIQISKNADFSTTFFSDSSITDTSYLCDAFSYSTRYYWRVRGINSCYIGSWSNAWYFTTKSAPSGCPYIFTWDGKEYNIENNILPQSDNTLNKNTMVTDYYKLLQPPIEDQGKYNLEICEFENERSDIDNIKLLEVDHNINTDIAIMPDGNIVEYQPSFKLISCSSSEVTEKLSSMDGTIYNVNKNDKFTLNFEPVIQDYSTTKSTNIGGILLGGQLSGGKRGLQSLPKPTKVASVTPINGNITANATSFTFRERPTLVYVSLDKLTTTVSFNFTSDCVLDYASLVSEVAEPSYKVTELPLLKAHHSKIGNITEKLSSNDGSIEQLYPGESIRLTYQATPIEQGKKRSFIIEVLGKYINVTGDEAKRVPSSFHLDEAYPNPFNPSTTIKYEIPKAGRVQLEIFNQLGQMVKSLTDASQEAGYYTQIWNASEVPSGVYYIRLLVTDQLGKQLFFDTKKIVVMK